MSSPEVLKRARSLHLSKRVGKYYVGRTIGEVSGGWVGAVEQCCSRPACDAGFMRLAALASCAGQRSRR